MDQRKYLGRNENTSEAKFLKESKFVTVNVARTTPR